MRPDKPQFWTGGGEGAGVNLAMTEMTKPNILWNPITNLTERTLVDVNIDCREMSRGKLNIIQDGVIKNIITNPVQKNIFVAPSQSLSFETIKTGMGAYDIFIATFSRIALDVSAQDIAPTSMIFNNNGTKLYVLGAGNGNINEYNLAIPYDIFTATFFRIALNVNAQETNPNCMIFNNNGTKLYVLGTTSDNINEYNLTTPYDIFTATFSRIALDVSARETFPTSMIFNNNGTKLYVIGVTNNNINEYNLITPYDIFTATFFRIALNVSTQETNPTSMIFNNDGTKLYVLGHASDNINEYNLTTPYDIFTATFFRIALNVKPQEKLANCIIFNNDGGKLYLTGQNSDNINEYTIGDLKWTGNVKIRTINN